MPAVTERRRRSLRAVEGRGELAGQVRVGDLCINAVAIGSWPSPSRLTVMPQYH